MFSDLIYRVRALVRRRVVEQELDDELRFHLEQQAEKLRAGGVSQSEANRQARLQLEGPEQAKERCRDVRGIRLWDTLWQDLRYAARQVRFAPGFAAVTTLILAFGIGANTAIFSLLDAVVLRSLPVQNPKQLIVPRWTTKVMPRSYGEHDWEGGWEGRTPGLKGGATFSYPMFQLMEQRRDLFSGVAAYIPTSVNANARGAASIVELQMVSGSFFETLGVRAMLGRTVQPADDQVANTPVVVLAYTYWQKTFGGDRSVLGRVIRLNNASFTVVGVAEPRFYRLSPGRRIDLWTTIHASGVLGLDWLKGALSDEHQFWLKMIARVQPGISEARVESELTTLFRNEMVSRAKVMERTSDAAIEVAPADRALTGIREMLGRPLTLLMGAVGLILLLVSLNVAGLMSARAASREREIAIRLAVGAGGTRIARQFLTQSLLLAAMGGLGGLAIAFWGTTALARMLPVGDDVKPDMRVLLFTSVISIASGVFFGMVPVVRSAHVTAFLAFGRSSAIAGQMSPSALRRGMGNALVVMQVALAVMMLAGAGLMMRTLMNLTSINPGFKTENLLLFGIDPVSLHYNEARMRHLYQTLDERLRSLPGVADVSYSEHPLLTGGRGAEGFRIEGRHDSVSIAELRVGPDFFRALGIAVLAGREFTAQDVAGSQQIAIVNQTFQKRYFPGHSALGRHLGDNEIVGVISDNRHVNLRADIEPTAYLPLRTDSATFEVRSFGSAANLIPAVTRIANELAPDLPLSEIKTQAEQIGDLLLVERLVARLAAGFGLLALGLACAGIYGLLSYEVARRTREIGIRIAIGARPWAVKAKILRETLSIVAVGVAIGIPAALIGTRALDAILYGVKRNDPATLLAITLTLMVVGGIAGYLPARRASAIDPTVALRSE